jgi:hypothetical protein
MGDHKMVGVNENLTHHRIIIDVIKKLRASPSGREGIRLCIKLCKGVRKDRFIALDMIQKYH